MNWEMIGAIAQLVAAVGVVPTLLFLAFQVREEDRARRRWCSEDFCRAIDAIIADAAEPAAYGELAAAGSGA